MLKALRPSLVLLIVMTLLLGVAYPTCIWAFGRIFFADKAQGSILYDHAKIIGSALIGQDFHQSKYFWPRPSVTLPTPYSFMGSQASNQNMTNPALLDDIRMRTTALSPKGQPVPVDLVTSSASGLDPHISPQAALFQVERVSIERGLPTALVTELVLKHIEGKTFGFLGERRVNVLKLNLALDQVIKDRHD